MPKFDKKTQKDTKASVETTRQTAAVVDIQPVIADKTFVNLLKPADTVTVTDVNAEMSKEYGWLGKYRVPPSLGLRYRTACTVRHG